MTKEKRLVLFTSPIWFYWPAQKKIYFFLQSDGYTCDFGLDCTTIFFFLFWWLWCSAVSLLSQLKRSACMRNADWSPSKLHLTRQNRWQPRRWHYIRFYLLVVPGKNTEASRSGAWYISPMMALLYCYQAFLIWAVWQELWPSQKNEQGLCGLMGVTP